MSTRTTVRLLGPPSIQLGLNGRVEPLTAGSARLLAYLLLESRDHSRERLATILWPELPYKEGRTRLRNCVHRLRTVVGDGALVTSRDRIGISPHWSVDTDVWKIARGVSQVQAHHPHEPEQCEECSDALQKLQRYYELPLLEGCLLPDSTEFDDWLTATESAIRGSIEWAREWLSELGRPPPIGNRATTSIGAINPKPLRMGHSGRSLPDSAGEATVQGGSPRLIVPFVLAAVALLCFGLVRRDSGLPVPVPNEVTRDPETWAFDVAAADSQLHGLTWDGSSFWIVATDTNRLLKVGPNGDLISSVDGPPGALSGITFDGTHLWVGTFDSYPGHTNGLYQVDPVDGSVLTFIDCPNGDLTGVAWDGESFWYADWSHGGRIRRVNRHGELLQSFRSPAGTPEGLVYIRGSQRLYSVDTANAELHLLGLDGRVIGEWPLPISDPMGLTHDGTHFWVVGRESGRVHRLSISGDVPNEERPVLAPVVAGEIPGPVAETGNWEAYLAVPDLDGQVGPIPFSMLQTGTRVDASDGFVGSIEGLLLTLTGYLAELPVALIGTISESGEVIEGAINGELNGTFRFEQPTELPYGHIDLQATVDGVSAELSSEWALADFHGDDYDWTVEVGYNDPHSNTLVLIKFEVPLYEVPLETEVPATIFLWRDADGEDLYAAWTDAGVVILTVLTESSIAGEFLISEPHAQVSGSFDVGFWDNPF